LPRSVLDDSPFLVLVLAPLSEKANTVGELDAEHFQASRHGRLVPRLE